MSITDELRAWAKEHLSRSSILAIADRIDAAVEGMVELPKDADDVPWNVGDRDEDGNVVTQLRLTSAGWFIITDGNWPYRPKHKRHRHAPTVEDVLREFSEKMNENLGMYTGEAIDADEWRQADSKTIAEYAAKLRLAEGEDA